MPVSALLSSRGTLKQIAVHAALVRTHRAPTTSPMWTSALEAAVGPDWLLLARLAELPEQQKVQVMHGMITHDTARDLLKSKQERSAMQGALVARHEEIPRRGVASYRTPHNQAFQNLQPSVSKPWPEQEPVVAPEPTQAEMASFNALNILATIVPEGYQNRPAPPPPQKRSQSAQGRSRRFQGAAKSPRDELWCTLTATDRPVLAATSGRAAAARSHRSTRALEADEPLPDPCVENSLGQASAEPHVRCVPGGLSHWTATVSYGDHGVRPSDPHGLFGATRLCVHGPAKSDVQCGGVGCDAHGRVHGCVQEALDVYALRGSMSICACLNESRLGKLDGDKLCE